MAATTAEQDRRLSGLKEIGAAFVEERAPSTVSKYIKRGVLRIRGRVFGRKPWCNVSDVRRCERENGLAE